MDPVLSAYSCREVNAGAEPVASGLGSRASRNRKLLECASPVALSDFSLSHPRRYRGPRDDASNFCFQAG